MSERCKFLDGAGCRCLLPLNHRGVHDPSYTRWAETPAGLLEKEQARREREKLLRAAAGSL